MKMTDKRIARRIWAATASTPVAIALFVVIIGVSLAGTFTKADVYHSWWFVTLLALFGANLLSCTLKTVSERRARAGSLVTHAGILLVLAGAIVGAGYAVRGQVNLAEGGKADSYVTNGGTEKLPFEIRLDDFEIAWPNDVPHTLDIHVDDPPATLTLDIKPGDNVPVGDTGYTVKALRFVPHLFVDQAKGVMSLSDDPVNPALQLAISHGQTTETRWVFAAHPEVRMATDRNFAVKYRYETHPVDYTSRVTITDRDGGVTRGEIKVNHPLRHRGWALYQARFDVKRPGWTGLDAVRDPGTDIVFAGIALMNVGVFLVLYRRFRKLRTPST